MTSSEMIAIAAATLLGLALIAMPVLQVSLG